MTDSLSPLLIVDDNEDNRYTLSRRLQRHGYQNLTFAEDGAKALESMGGLLTPLVSTRVDYQEAARHGMGTTELNPHGVAAEEMRETRGREADQCAERGNRPRLLGVELHRVERAGDPGVDRFHADRFTQITCQLREFPFCVELPEHAYMMLGYWN